MWSCLAKVVLAFRVGMALGASSALAGEGEEACNITEPGAAAEGASLLQTFRNEEVHTLAQEDHSMHLEGHTVSSISSRWHDKVVYGVFTSSIPAYHEKLVAQMETWAEPLVEEGRFFAIGAQSLPESWQKLDVVLPSECEDGWANLSCKEANIIAEGAARGASWLGIFGEDNYVDVEGVEEFLASKDPDSPVSFGVIGCGKRLYCIDNPEFEQEGGFCGGAGYFLSRKTLQILVQDGATALHQIYDARPWPNDMTTSCELRKRQVSMTYMPLVFGNRMASMHELERRVRLGFYTLHYLKPEEMRWVHTHKPNSTSQVKRA